MTPTKSCQRGLWIDFLSIIPRGRVHEHIVVLASFSIHPDDWAQARGRTSDTASGHREAIIVVIRGLRFRITVTEIKRCDKAHGGQQWFGSQLQIVHTASRRTSIDRGWDEMEAAETSHARHYFLGGDQI